MTAEAILRMYANAQRYVDDGAGVVLLPGELNGEYTIAAWAWGFTPAERPLAFHPHPEVRLRYAIQVAINVRGRFEAEHGLALA